MGHHFGKEILENDKKSTTETLYKLIEETEEEVYVYVRKKRGIEVGFSALPIATLNPDFSDCGVFWVREVDFKKIFEPYVMN